MRYKLDRLRIFPIVFGSMLIMFLSSMANAVPIICADTTNNYMEMDTSQASACAGAGLGNINGNPATDDFLLGGGTAAGYVSGGSGSAVQTGFNLLLGTEFGTWSVDASVDAIGFKFGTGNTADEWFVFDLIAGVTSGDWTFFDVLANGNVSNPGRISHFETYYKTPNVVSEPGTLLFLPIALFGLSLARRKKLFP